MTPPPFIERIFDEQRELREKMVKLGQFIVSERFRTLGPRQQYLLQRQQEVMLQYHAILDWRVEDMSANPPEPGAPT